LSGIVRLYGGGSIRRREPAIPRCAVIHSSVVTLRLRFVLRGGVRLDPDTAIRSAKLDVERITEHS
jgi:hypothetical protein